MENEQIVPYNIHASHRESMDILNRHYASALSILTPEMIMIKVVYDPKET
jgi:hypothetical protein